MIGRGGIPEVGLSVIDPPASSVSFLCFVAFKHKTNHYICQCQVD